MKKSRVYTKTGDSGQTGLVSGSRISKADDRIDLYGELDELNSRIGLACAHLPAGFTEELEVLHTIQSSIFDLGSNLACESAKRAEYKLPQISSHHVSELELEIDRMEEGLMSLKNFILPGGSVAGATFHLCRTNARAVERKLIAYNEHTKEELPQNSLQFLNRLSDYFFVLARYVNHKEARPEQAWKPRKS
jgi:cob(I)alamin adenosyltransferase